MTVSLELYRQFVKAGNPVDDDEYRTMINTMALASEAGEVVDLLVKYMVHGVPVDRDAMVKEMGDVLWYFTLLCVQHDLSLSEIMDTNVEKLCERHPNWYGKAERWHDIPKPRPGQPLSAMAKELTEDKL